MYSVEEISNELSVSKVTIYNDLKRFKSELSPHIRVEKRCKYLTVEGFNLLCSLRGVKEVNKVDLNKGLNSGLIDQLYKQLEDSKEQVNYLKSQLELSQKNLEKEQQLHEHVQILLKQEQDRSLLLEHQLDDKASDKVQKTLWEKIFGISKVES